MHRPPNAYLIHTSFSQSFIQSLILTHRHLIAKAELSKSVSKTDEMENAFDYLWSQNWLQLEEMMKIL
jgi:hypothetical protein